MKIKALTDKAYQKLTIENIEELESFIGCETEYSTTQENMLIMPDGTYCHESFISTENTMETNQNTETKKPSNPFAFAMCDEMSMVQNGMTLKDYFAIKEKAVLTNTFWNCESFQRVITERSKVENKSCSKIMAEMAYYEADQMLKQREIENI